MLQGEIVWNRMNHGLGMIFFMGSLSHRAQRSCKMPMGKADSCRTGARKQSGSDKVISAGCLLNQLL